MTTTVICSSTVSTTNARPWTERVRVAVTVTANVTARHHAGPVRDRRHRAPRTNSPWRSCSGRWIGMGKPDTSVLPMISSVGWPQSRFQCPSTRSPGLGHAHFGMLCRAVPLRPGFAPSSHSTSIVSTGRGSSSSLSVLSRGTSLAGINDDVGVADRASRGWRARPSQATPCPLTRPVTDWNFRDGSTWTTQPSSAMSDRQSARGGTSLKSLTFGQASYPAPCGDLGNRDARRRPGPGTAVSAAAVTQGPAGARKHTSSRRRDGNRVTVFLLSYQDAVRNLSERAARLMREIGEEGREIPGVQPA